MNRTAHNIGKLGSARVSGEHLEVSNDGDLTPADLAQIDAQFAHHIVRVSSGYGPGGKHHMSCSCGWSGPVREEYQGDCYIGLRNDEAGHRAASR